MRGWRGWPICVWAYTLWRRLTGRDLIERSERSLAEATEIAVEEKLERAKVLEANATLTAANYRSANMHEAAQLEHEKALAFAARRKELSRVAAAAREAHGDEVAVRVWGTE